VQIERALAVVGRSVEETRSALDRAEVEPTEREAPRSTGGGLGTTSIGAVLSWAEDFARRGHDRLRHGGQDGIASFVNEAEQLSQLVHRLVEAIPQASTLSGVESVPVRGALEALEKHIGATGELAERLRITPMPIELNDAEFYRRAVVEILETDPPNTETRTDLVISLRGRGFHKGTTVRLSPANLDSKVLRFVALSDTLIQVVVRDHRTGDLVDKIVVRQPDGSAAELIVPPETPPKGGN
jgi:hypothetical protein